MDERKLTFRRRHCEELGLESAVLAKYVVREQVV